MFYFIGVSKNTFITFLVTENNNDVVFNEILGLYKTVC
jgi:hypothetical protein